MTKALRERRTAPLFFSSAASPIHTSIHTCRERPPASMNVAVVTVSDRVSRGEAIDATGPAVIEAVTNSLAGSSVTHTAVVEDDAVGIAALLRKLADEDHLQLVLTCGGTGFTPRDVTPEATKAVIERECPGLVVAMITGSLAVRHQSASLAFNQPALMRYAHDANNE